jgi:hypothetical protein
VNYKTVSRAYLLPDSARMPKATEKTKSAENRKPYCFNCWGCEGLGCKGVHANLDGPDKFEFITGVIGKCYG